MHEKLCARARRATGVGPGLEIQNGRGHRRNEAYGRVGNRKRDTNFRRFDRWGSGSPALSCGAQSRRLPLHSKQELSLRVGFKLARAKLNFVIPKRACVCTCVASKFFSRADALLQTGFFAGTNCDTSSREVEPPRNIGVSPGEGMIYRVLQTRQLPRAQRRFSGRQMNKIGTP